jgi:predicted TIM-barrel fold metal-dependent hydrolase
MQIGDIEAIDVLLGLPGPGYGWWEERIIPQVRTNADYSKHLAPHFYRDGVPEGVYENSFISTIIKKMDEFHVQKGVVSFAIDDQDARQLVTAHADRLIPTLNIDPHEGMKTLRDMERAVDELAIKGVAVIPAAFNPPIPIDDRRMYPIYAKCIELDIAALVSVGVPGPPIRFAAQMPELVDEVCWFYPELRMVLRHGGDPWIDLVVKMLHKWPNLYYATSGWVPKHYPKGIIDFANTRGADKIMWAGYYPYGLTYERIFSEMPNVPFRDHVWPRFLRDNAIAALKLDA